MQRLQGCTLNWRGEPEPIEMEYTRGNEFLDRNKQSSDSPIKSTHRVSAKPPTMPIGCRKTGNTNHGNYSTLGKTNWSLDKVGRQSRSHPHFIRANRGFDRAAQT
jgi:hypothetical protein